MRAGITVILLMISLVSGASVSVFAGSYDGEKAAHFPNQKKTIDDNKVSFSTSHSFVPYRIAHGGGGIDSLARTNSIEALNYSVKRGFRYIELDFELTTDGHLVCLHDWKKNFIQSFGIPTKRKLTLKEFNRLVKNKAKHRNCTMQSLSVWMKLHPDIIIVADLKQDAVKSSKLLLEKLPNAKAKVIPQINFPHNFFKVKSLGFKKIIWSLWRVPKMKNKIIISWVKNIHSAVCCCYAKEESLIRFSEELRSMGVVTYVHTVNSRHKKENYLNQFKLSEIMTDFLLPSD